MDSIQDILNSQEELLEILTENTKFLLTDAINNSKQLSSEEEIMKSAFTNRKLPNILKK
ncbi:MAG: hypothetical protein HYR97_01110 [Candidatus Melainabacteria bacterium]|nr:hypothetical protein [Candidatus Melainabacteria bacterium]